MPRILIDGSNMWIRAYTSTTLPPPGGPVYVVARMLQKVCKEFGKKNVLICWDNGSGGRRQADPNYKAGRNIIEGAWTDILLMKALVDSVGIANAWAEGYEADDVIGALTHYLSGDLYICSYDRDFYQLVTPKVKVLHQARKIKGKKHPRRLIDEAGVVEHFGCTPDRVVVLRSFKGDPSDKIPKLPIRFTAKFRSVFDRVIEQVTSVEEFYEYLGVFETKHQEILEEFRDRALLNQTLLRINTDIQISVQENESSKADFEKLCAALEITNIDFYGWDKPGKPVPRKPVPRKP